MEYIINRLSNMVIVERAAMANDNCPLFFEEIASAIKAAGLPIKGWRKSRYTETWVLDLVERPKYHPLTA